MKAGDEEVGAEALLLLGESHWAHWDAPIAHHRCQQCQAQHGKLTRFLSDSDMLVSGTAQQELRNDISYGVAPDTVDQASRAWLQLLGHIMVPTCANPARGGDHMLF